MGKNKAYFECVHPTQKPRKCTGMVMVSRESRSEERGVKEEARGTIWMGISKEGAKKKQR